MTEGSAEMVRAWVAEQVVVTKCEVNPFQRQARLDADQKIFLKGARKVDPPSITYRRVVGILLPNDVYHSGKDARKIVLCGW